MKTSLISNPVLAAIAAGPARQADRGGLAGGPDGGGRHGLVGLVRLVYYRHLDCRPACLDHGHPVRRVRPVGRHPPAGHRPHGFTFFQERLVTHDATFAALASIRVQLFRGWSRASGQPPAAPAGKLLFRLTADIDALESLYLRLLVPAFTALCVALLAGVALGVMQWQLGLGSAAWLLSPAAASAGAWRSVPAVPPSCARAPSKNAFRHHRPGGRWRARRIW